MATSSFTKNFVIRAEAVKKIQDIQKTASHKVPAPAYDRIKEGKKALKTFYEEYGFSELQYDEKDNLHMLYLHLDNTITF